MTYGYVYITDSVVVLESLAGFWDNPKYACSYRRSLSDLVVACGGADPTVLSRTSVHQRTRFLLISGENLQSGMSGSITADRTTQIAVMRGNQ